MLRPETFIGGLCFLAMLALGFWYGGGFRVFWLARPVISG